MRGPEGLGDEVDPVEERGEPETEMTPWKRGRCG